MLAAAVDGSSPHTRGARSGSARSGACRADHPRIRGEHAILGGGPAVGEGSSPHTRGAREGCESNVAGRGIIPAYAGSTHRPRSERPHRRDHPRIRGEHETPSTHAVRASGSSPHTRGAHLPEADGHEKRRIIPAYAGSTKSTSTPPATLEDHPRIRGEHAALASQAHSIAGSSPHTRGALQHHTSKS